MKTLWYKDKTTSMDIFLIKTTDEKTQALLDTQILPEVMKTVHLATLSEHNSWKSITPVGLIKHITSLYRSCLSLLKFVSTTIPNLYSPVTTVIVNG